MKKRYQRELRQVYDEATSQALKIVELPLGNPVAMLQKAKTLQKSFYKRYRTKPEKKTRLRSTEDYAKTTEKIYSRGFSIRRSPIKTKRLESHFRQRKSKRSIQLLHISKLVNDAWALIIEAQRSDKLKQIKFPVQPWLRHYITRHIKMSPFYL